MMTTQYNKQIQHCIDQFGTPTYLYFSEVIDRQFQSLKKLIEIGFRIYYSMKANPTLGICQYISRLGLGCEVSSSYELMMALKAGFNNKNIIFVGPAKTKNDLELAIQHEIRFIVCESFYEAQRVNEISSFLNKKTEILIRINPHFSSTSAKFKMTGVPSQFGIDIDEFIENINQLKSHEHIYVSGIQVYSGTRNLDAQSIIENTKNVFQLSDFIKTKCGIECRVIDIGGGFGVPYYDDEEVLNIEFVVNHLIQLYKHQKQHYSNIEIILEIGRYLIADAGVLIGKIISAKNSHGKKYLILDAGLHCHFSASSQGSMIHRNFPMRVLNDNSSNPIKCTYQICGPSCSPGDLLGININLSNKNYLDYHVVFERVGAYGLTFSPGRFISHGYPSEIFYYQNQFNEVRRRESFLDILSTQFEII